MLPRTTVRLKVVEGLSGISKGGFSEDPRGGRVNLAAAHGSSTRLDTHEQSRLTEYGVGPRYPGWGDVSLAEARRAVALARRVREHVRSLLPKDFLRPRAGWRRVGA